jgi:hypothetical protein
MQEFSKKGALRLAQAWTFTVALAFRLLSNVDVQADHRSNGEGLSHRQAHTGCS